MLPALPDDGLRAVEADRAARILVAGAGGVEAASPPEGRAVPHLTERRGAGGGRPGEMADVVLAVEGPAAGRHPAVVVHDGALPQRDARERPGRWEERRGR